MDGGGGFLPAITRWLTPPILFCLLNLMVITIFFRSTLKPKKNNNQEQHYPPLITQENDPVQFFRFPSLLQKVKSFNFSRTNVDEPAEISQYAEPEKEKPVEEKRQVARTMSDTMEVVVKRQVVRGGVKVMKKSLSAKIIVRVEEMEEEEVEVVVVESNETVPFDEDEAKADEFINRFKQQLKLQRLESFLKYRGDSK